MNRVLIVITIIVFCHSTSPLMSSEKNLSDAHLKKGIVSDHRKDEFYVEYKRIQEELSKEYEKIRDEVINGYLLRKLQMCYKELQLLEKSLRDKYKEEKRELIDRHFNDTEKQN